MDDNMSPVQLNEVTNNKLEVVIEAVIDATNEDVEVENLTNASPKINDTSQIKTASPKSPDEDISDFTEINENLLKGLKKSPSDRSIYANEVVSI